MVQRSDAAVGDAEVKGFALRGAKSFLLDYRAEGRQRGITIGSCPDWSVDISTHALGDFTTHTFAVAAAEVQKLYHDPLELLTRAVQTMLWLMLFGEVMAHLSAVADARMAQTWCRTLIRQLIRSTRSER